MGRLRVGNMPGGLHIEDVDTVVKVITVGNGAVGKTSLIRRFCEGVFTGVYQKTLAVDFDEKQDFVVPGVEEPGSKQNTHSVLSRTHVLEFGATLHNITIALS